MTDLIWGGKCRVVFQSIHCFVNEWLQVELLILINCERSGFDAKQKSALWNQYTKNNKHIVRHQKREALSGWVKCTNSKSMLGFHHWLSNKEQKEGTKNTRDDRPSFQPYVTMMNTYIWTLDTVWPRDIHNYWAKTLAASHIPKYHIIHLQYVCDFFFRISSSLAMCMNSLTVWHVISSTEATNLNTTTN